MSAPLSLGDFEQVVLLAILRLDDQAYGLAIRNAIAACTDRAPAPGAVYTTLDRLEEKGLVTSRYGDATPERGGRARRYFTVTPQGVRALSRPRGALWQDRGAASRLDRLECWHMSKALSGQDGSPARSAGRNTAS